MEQNIFSPPLFFENIEQDNDLVELPVVYTVFSQYFQETLWILYQQFFARICLQAEPGKKEELEHAINIQKIAFTNGKQVHLGQLLLADYILEPQKLYSLLRKSGNEILFCKTCNQYYQRMFFKEEKNCPCPRCSKNLEKNCPERQILLQALRSNCFQLLSFTKSSFEEHKDFLFVDPKNSIKKGAIYWEKEIFFLFHSLQQWIHSQLSMSFFSQKTKDSQEGIRINQIQKIVQKTLGDKSVLLNRESFFLGYMQNLQELFWLLFQRLFLKMGLIHLKDNHLQNALKSQKRGFENSKQYPIGEAFLNTYSMNEKEVYGILQKLQHKIYFCQPCNQFLIQQFPLCYLSSCPSCGSTDLQEASPDTETLIRGLRMNFFQPVLFSQNSSISYNHFLFFRNREKYTPSFLFSPSEFQKAFYSLVQEEKEKEIESMEVEIVDSQESEEKVSFEQLETSDEDDESLELQIEEVEEIEDKKLENSEESSASDVLQFEMIDSQEAPKKDSRQETEKMQSDQKVRFDESLAEKDCEIIEISEEETSQKIEIHPEKSKIAMEEKGMDSCSVEMDLLLQSLTTEESIYDQCPSLPNLKPSKTFIKKTFPAGKRVSKIEGKIRSDKDMREKTFLYRCTKILRQKKIFSPFRRICNASKSLSFLDQKLSVLSKKYPRLVEKLSILSLKLSGNLKKLSDLYQAALRKKNISPQNLILVLIIAFCLAILVVFFSMPFSSDKEHSIKKEENSSQRPEEKKIPDKSDIKKIPDIPEENTIPVPNIKPAIPYQNSIPNEKKTPDQAETRTPWWKELLQSRPENSNKIAEALIKLSSSNELSEKDIPFLKEMYQQYISNEQIRLLFIYTIGRIINQESIAWLSEIAVTGSQRDRVAAIDSLANANKPEAKEAIMNLFQRERSGSMCIKMVDILSRSGREDREVYQNLNSKFYEVSDEDIQLGILTSMSHMKIPEQSNFFIEIASNRLYSEAVRIEAIDALLLNTAENASQFINQLSALAETEQGTIRQVIETGLKRFQSEKKY